MTLNPKEQLQSLLQKTSLVFLVVALVVRPLVSGMSTGLDVGILIQLFPLLSAMLWLFGMILNREMQILPTRLEIPIALFLFCVFLSVLSASCKLLSVVTAFDWSVDIFLFFLIFQYASDASIRRKLENIFVATALVIACYGLYQRIWGFAEMTDWLTQHPSRVKSMFGLDENNWIDFKSRLATYEVFSTFVIPNALAGYFLFILPVLWARIFVLGKEGQTYSARFLVNLLAIASVSLCMLWTGAKAAWACLPIQFMLFLILLGDQISKKKRRNFIGAITGFLVVGFILITTIAQLKPYGLALLDSLQVRLGYWETAWRMITDGTHFLFGVGIGNFQEVYPFYKTVDASEVQKAHNHYIQLWAEIGLIGLGSFIALWSTFYWKCLSADLRKTDFKKGKVEINNGLLVIGGILAFLVAYFYSQPFKTLPTSTNYTWLTIALFGFWCLVVYLQSKGEQPSDIVQEKLILRAGYLSGISGLLLHSVVDFDLSVPGNAQTLWFLAAMSLSLIPGKTWYRFKLGPASQIALTIASVLCFSSLTLGAFSRLATSETLKASGEAFLSQAVQNERIIRADLLPSSIEEFTLATKSNPYDPDLYLRLGTALKSQWRISKDPEIAHKAYLAMRNATRLAPFRAGFHLRLGQLLEELAIQPRYFFFEEVLSDYKGATHSELKRIDRVFHPAFQEYSKGATLYSSKPAYRLPLADFLWKIKNRDAARNHYKMILELDDQIHPRWKNLKLAVVDRKRVEGRGRKKHRASNIGRRQEP